jgi:hypothetical protein
MGKFNKFVVAAVMAALIGVSVSASPVEAKKAALNRLQGNYENVVTNGTNMGILGYVESTEDQKNSRSYMKVGDSSILKVQNSLTTVETPDGVLTLRKVTPTYSNKASRSYNTVNMKNTQGVPFLMIQDGTGAKWKLLQPNYGSRVEKTQTIEVDTNDSFVAEGSGWQKSEKLPKYMSIEALNKYTAKSNYVHVAQTKGYKEGKLAKVLVYLWYGDLLAPDKGEANTTRNSLGYQKSAGSQEGKSNNHQVALDFSDSKYEDVNDPRFQSVSKDGTPVKMDSVLSYRVTGFVDSDSMPSSAYTYYVGARNGRMYAMYHRDGNRGLDEINSTWKPVQFYGQYEYVSMKLKK